MPFKHGFRPYTRDRVKALNPNQNGVYGLFRGNVVIYIGSGDIPTRLLAHLDGDNACITKEAPDQWTDEVLKDDPTRREGELIQEYAPICNKVIPR
ncbi:MAG: hypothetical protein H8D32_02570 [Dehalococcoidia bacterium]|nr:hypothetical protein [Dehalococcoidia bacterium]